MKKLLFLLVSAFCSVFSANAALSTTDLANNDYIGTWGRLKLVGNQLSSESGEAIQLKGWSTFSINYDEVKPCLTKAGFTAMKSWGANVVRLAVYPKNSKGDITQSTTYTTTVTNVKQYITWCHDLKMYVLVDWHVLDGDGNSGDPSKYQTQAKQFFTDIASFAKAQGYTNVLYEACNEPSGVTWSAIKTYATTYVLPVINSNDPGAICIVGTPQWDQNVGEAVNSPIAKSSFPNVGIMYAFHFYAATHMYLVGNFSGACSSLPMFVSEWGSSNALGSGSLDLTDSNTFLGYCNKGNNGKQLVSWCYWAWGKKDEASNCLTSCDSYSSSSLSAAGNYIVPVLTGSTSIPTIAQSKAWGGAAQTIPSAILSTSTKYIGVLNVGFFDLGGEGVAYHDANSSKYTDDERTVLNTAGTEYTNCNAGAVYSGNLPDLSKCFRADSECVDVSTSTAGLDGNYSDPGDGYGNSGSDLHNLCMTEGGEWINYTINVTKKGYYSLQVLTTTDTKTSGTISLVKAGANGGNIVRDLTNREDLTARPDFKLQAMSSADCKAKNISGYTGAENWLCWQWNDVMDPANETTDNVGVVFYDEGEQTITLNIVKNETQTDATPGNFSNILFTFVDANFSKAEIAAHATGVETVAATTPEFAMYPNPSNGSFTIDLGNATDAANVTVMDMTGRVAYTEAFVGKTTINKTFNKGVYVVRVQTAGGVKTQKMNVE